MVSQWVKMDPVVTFDAEPLNACSQVDRHRPPILLCSSVGQLTRFLAALSKPFRFLPESPRPTWHSPSPWKNFTEFPLLEQLRSLGSCRARSHTMKPVPWLAAGIVGILHLVQAVQATKLLESHALIPCSDGDAISINKFSVVFTPDNHTVTVSFDGSTSYSGKVMLEVQLLVYGYLATTKTVDPCDYHVYGLCPMKPATLNFPTTALSDVPQDALPMIPGKSLETTTHWRHR